MPPIPCFYVCKREDGHWERPGTTERRAEPYEFGPGAVYDAAWIRDREPEYWALCRKYPDQIVAAVITPDGPWVIDGPSFDGMAYKTCPWTRTGDPRAPASLNVTPSIHFPGRYHGWLRSGVLVNA